MCSKPEHDDKETTMKKGNTLKQMNEYDFTTPINVTMIFEDSNDGLNNVVSEQIIIDEYDDNDVQVENNNDHSTASKVISVNKSLKKITMYCHKSLSTKENKLTEKSSLITEENINGKYNIEVNQRPLMQNNCIPKAADGDVSNNVLEMHQQLDQTEELNENIKQLLGIVSENLIFIMKPYISLHSNIGLNNDPDMAAKLKKQLCKLKEHFFDLSYSTVVTVILPQEKNKLFVDNFLNKTAADANKMFNWKCDRKHIEPFYNEMIKWVKQKRQYILSLACRTNADKNSYENITNVNKTLKEHLAFSPRAINVPCITNTSTQSYSGVPNPCKEVSNTENTTCIFSSGDPDRQVSISVNPNLLTNHTKQNNIPYKEASKMELSKRRKKNSDVHSTNSPTHSKQVYYDPYVKQVQQNGYIKDTIHYSPNAPPPPSYYTIHNVGSSNVAPSIPNNLNPLQNNATLITTNPNYHRQINSNSCASSTYNNTKIAQMYYRNVEQHLPTAPLQMNVTPYSLHNQMIYPTMGRCCICGKNTYSRCSKCNDFSYCSTLCQELDVAPKKSTCQSCNCLP